jgi:hypothetical protein
LPGGTRRTGWQSSRGRPTVAVKNFSGQDVTGEPVTWPEEKRCGHCKHLKPAGEFGKNKGKRDGLQTYCKICTSAYRKAHNAQPHAKAAAREYNRRPEVKARKNAQRASRPRSEQDRTRDHASHLRRTYNITADDYERMLIAQGGGCAICGRKPAKNQRLAVDHDHSCCPGRGSCGNCIRGLLCTRCNHKTLGHCLQEGTKGTAYALGIARNLVQYLERGIENAGTGRAA